jgi:hypothetical protein
MEGGKERRKEGRKGEERTAILIKLNPKKGLLHRYHCNPDEKK